MISTSCIVNNNELEQFTATKNLTLPRDKIMKNDHQEKMRKLIVHVGTPKTGTSAIQHFLEENIVYLAQNGIKYDSWNNPQNIITIMRQKNEPREKATQIIGLFEDYNCLVISCEGIWTYWYNNPEVFSLVSKLGIDVQVVVSLRNQIEYIQSMIEQKIKDSFYSQNPDIISPEIIEDTYDRDILKSILITADYCRWIDVWENAVGRENIHILNYQPSSKCVIKSFCDILGISSFINYENTIVNPSLNGSLLAIKLEINRKLKEYSLPEEDVNSVFLHVLFNSLQKSEETNVSKNRKIFFHKEQQKEIARMFAQGNEYLQERYGLQPIINEENYEVSELPIRTSDSSDYLNIIINQILDLDFVNKKIKTQELNLHEKETIFQQELDDMKNSYSWKITKPLRVIKQFVGKTKRK